MKPINLIETFGAYDGVASIGSGYKVTFTAQELTSVDTLYQGTMMKLKLDVVLNVSDDIKDVEADAEKWFKVMVREYLGNAYSRVAKHVKNN